MNEQQITELVIKHGLFRVPKPKYHLEIFSKHEIEVYEAERKGWNAAIFHFRKFLKNLTPKE